MQRKIVQLVASESTGASGALTRTLYALDEDGHAWVIDPYDSEAGWRELPSLPDKPKRPGFAEIL